jgi:hypothetical protein
LHMTPITRLAASGLSVLDPGRNTSLGQAYSPAGATSVSVVDGRDRISGRMLHLRVFDGGRRS